MKTNKTRNCKVCGVIYSPYSSLQVACSVKCAIKLQNQKKKSKLEQMKDTAYGRERLITKLDDITSKIVIKRYKGRCVTCGSVEKSPYNRPTNGHLITRGKHSLRWDVREDGNCHCQCWRCNLKHEYEPNHYVNWYIGEFGLERHSALIKEGNISPNYKEWQLKDMLEERKQILKRLEEDEKQGEGHKDTCEETI